MRILVVGANGMVGHRLWMAARRDHEAWATVRGRLGDAPWRELFDSTRTVEGVSAEDGSSLDRALDVCRPDVVINALGVIKQRPEGMDPGAAFTANCVVPHHLRARCDAIGARLIQVSTDCVFTGARGCYTELDQPDATDTYGLSKRLGEVGAPHLTLRTSVIGRSLSGTTGLVEWFLSQSATVSGFRRAIYSGVTTAVLADTIVEVAERQTSLSGVWHVASPPINKYDLLLMLGDALDHRVEITPVDEPVIDRSLDDSRFRGETGIPRPAWAEMVAALASDPTPYASLRGEPERTRA